MVRICKTYDAKLKAKVALEALKGEASILEIAKNNNIPKTNIMEWKNKLNECAESIFTPAHERDKVIRDLNKEIESMHKIIGEITIENNFLKKKLK
jgi:transposase